MRTIHARLIVLGALVAFLAPLFNFASAETGTTTPTTTPPVSTSTPPRDKDKDKIKRPELKPTDPVCMQNAIEKRDTAIIAGFDAYHNAVKAALQARKDALKTAWGLADKKARREALRTAWKTWRESWRKASADLKKIKRDIWTQFYNERKACGPQATVDDATNTSADIQL